MLYRTFLVPVSILAAITIAACSDRGGELTTSDDWALELVPPIQNATFSLSESHLPEAPRVYRDGIHQGFDFFNGSAISRGTFRATRTCRGSTPNCNWATRSSRGSPSG